MMTWAGKRKTCLPDSHTFYEPRNYSRGAGSLQAEQLQGSNLEYESSVSALPFWGALPATPVNRNLLGEGGSRTRFTPRKLRHVIALLDRKCQGRYNNQRKFF
jgi:hypothetical protein